MIEKITLIQNFLLDLYNSSMGWWVFDIRLDFWIYDLLYVQMEAWCGHSTCHHTYRLQCTACHPDSTYYPLCSSPDSSNEQCRHPLPWLYKLVASIVVPKFPSLSQSSPMILDLGAPVVWPMSDPRPTVACVICCSRDMLDQCSLCGRRDTQNNVSFDRMCVLLGHVYFRIEAVIIVEWY